MPQVGFEPTFSAGERPKTHALDRAATGRGLKIFDQINYKAFLFLGRYFLYFTRIPFKDNEIKSEHTNASYGTERMNSNKSTSRFVLQRLTVKDTVKHIHLVSVSCFRTRPDDGPFGPQHVAYWYTTYYCTINIIAFHGGLHQLINQAVTFLTCNGNNLNSAGTLFFLFEKSVCVHRSF